MDGHDNVWHTIVNVGFQSAPRLQDQIESGASPNAVLEQDPQWVEMIEALRSGLPFGELKKWKTSPRYKARFCSSFTATWPSHRPLVSACSFQEKTLRECESVLLKAYNEHIGGLEGRGIGFESFDDQKGRRCIRHSYVDMSGLHEIIGRENKMLVLLFLAWFVADQHAFHRQEVVDSGKHGFDRLALTVVSDILSEDNDSSRKGEALLRWLIDPEAREIPIVLTRSPLSDSFSGDLLADNLAGWLTAAISEPTGEFGILARDAAPSGVWAGWHVLKSSTGTLESTAAVDRLLEPGEV